MFTFDDIRIEKIIDLDPFPLPFSFIFPDAQLTDLRRERRLLMEHHIDFDRAEVLLGCHSFLLRTRNLNILIETCVGENKARPRLPIWNHRERTGYLKRLQDAGISPEDINIVVCTHLHADHIGWNTRLETGQWVPTFPHARYLVPVAEILHWEAVRSDVPPGTYNHGAHEDSIVPLLEAGLIDIVDEGDKLDHGIKFVPLPGHTLGQLGLEITTDNGKLLLCGDAFHSPAQVWRPEWSSAFCADKDLARDTRRRLLQQAAAEGIIIVPSHMRSCAGMQIVREDNGFRPIFIDPMPGSECKARSFAKPI
jgi:glyoxylase-like metal-dependent hydrolase (beta-lactamase superfamily II)